MSRLLELELHREKLSSMYFWAEKLKEGETVFDLNLGGKVHITNIACEEFCMHHSENSLFVQVKFNDQLVTLCTLSHRQPQSRIKFSVDALREDSKITQFSFPMSCSCQLVVSGDATGCIHRLSH